MLTYWLYYNGNPVTAVRMSNDATEEQVRDEAVRQNRACPLCDVGEAPFEKELKIRHSIVKVFERF